MRKNDMEKKWNDTDIRNFLQRSAKEQKIPKNLHPNGRMAERADCRSDRQRGERKG